MGTSSLSFGDGMSKEGGRAMMKVVKVRRVMKYFIVCVGM